ncbi:MAG: hypothetical protein B6245_07865 [Desulfobacteraceae bacterium 4572_88]|nr:MAG: hypothetical protein B6245_07865 [Desulfobacteraceae bacterium 4572_88]
MEKFTLREKSDFLKKSDFRVSGRLVPVRCPGIEAFIVPRSGDPPPQEQMECKAVMIIAGRKL